MGLSIGQIPGGIARPGFAADTERLQGLRNRPGSRALGAPRPEGQDFALFRQDPAPTPRAGFGEGTVSGPGAALETIGQSVRNTRDIVPSIQELRAELRARRSEARRVNEQEPPQPREAREPREPREFRIESRLPEPSALARNFINDINDTAAANEARFSGEDPFEGQDGATAEINGEQIAFGVRINATQGRIFDGSRIDVSV